MKIFKWPLLLVAICLLGIFSTNAQTGPCCSQCNEALTISNANGLVSYRPWTFDPWVTGADPNGCGTYNDQVQVAKIYECETAYFNLRQLDLTTNLECGSYSVDQLYDICNSPSVGTCQQIRLNCADVTASTNYIIQNNFQYITSNVSNPSGYPLPFTFNGPGFKIVDLLVIGTNSIRRSCGSKVLVSPAAAPTIDLNLPASICTLGQFCTSMNFQNVRAYLDANFYDPTDIKIDFGDGSGPQSLCEEVGYPCIASQLCANYTQAGFYTVKAIYTTTCGTVTKDLKTIYVGPSTVAVSPTVASRCSNSANPVTLTATPSPASVTHTYLWSTGATTSSINVSPTTTTNYTVTVTRPGGCTATQTRQVSVLSNCCTGDVVNISCNGTPKSVDLTYADVNSSKLLSDLCVSGTTLTTASKIAINGTLTIDAGAMLTLLNCPKLVFGPNGRIEDNGSLVIDNSTLQACGTQMWQGVKVTSGLFVMANNSLIADADVAVYAINNGLMNIVDSRFFRNHIGIKLENMASPWLTISGNSFKYNPTDPLSNYLLSPYNGQRTETGVYVYSCTGVSIGNNYSTPNTFDGLYNGITSIASTVLVDKNNFFNIRKHGNTSALISLGTAVYGLELFSSVHTLTVKTVNGAISAFTPATFVNCDTAVLGYGISVNTDNNKIQSTSTGVAVYYGAANVVNNVIDQTDFGVTILNSSTKRNRVTNNAITVNAPPSPFLGITKNTYGVSQQEANATVPSNTRIENNTINNGRNCIQLNTCNNTLVSGNTLYQTAGANVSNNQACIYTTNCQNIYINSNSLTGNVNDYDDGSFPAILSNKRKSGVEFYNSYGTVCSNTSSTIGYGFNFVAGCSGTNLRNNTINSTKYGVTLKQSGSAGIIGTQGTLNSPAGNIFTGPFNNPSTYRTCSFNSNGALSPFFRFQSSDYPSPNGLIGTGAAITTSKSNLNNGYSCITGTYSKNGDDLIIAPESLETEYSIADDMTDGFSEEGFEAGNNWLSKKNLFDRLGTDPALRSENIGLDRFYADNLNSFFNRQKEIEQLLASTEETIRKDATQAKGQLADLKARNAAMHTGAQQEVYHQQCNELYIEAMSPGFTGFNKQQQSFIYNLANSCPYVNGDAVYRARTLYAQVDNHVFFDNEVLCASSRPSFKKEAATALDSVNGAFNIYAAPNPASGAITFFYNLEGNSNAGLTILNNLGQVVLVETLAAGEKQRRISIGHLSPGVYLYKATNNTGQIANGKFQVTR